jgi:hypothetical protein
LRRPAELCNLRKIPQPVANVEFESVFEIRLWRTTALTHIRSDPTSMMVPVVIVAASTPPPTRLGSKAAEEKKPGGDLDRSVSSTALVRGLQPLQRGT